MRIPKIIHRIWVGDKEMPPEFVSYGESWRRHHSDWEFKLWTDSNRPRLINETAYMTARSAADKSNILRYELLLNEGGVYVDTDFECRKSITNLISDKDAFAALQFDGVINNAIIGAVPNHTVLEAVVRGLEKNIARLPQKVASVFRSGPFYFGPVVKRFPNFHLFPPSMFYPYQWHERWKRNRVFKGAYAVHHWTLSGRFADFPDRKIVGSTSSPCLTVIILADGMVDADRLEWTLEALTVQTALNFDTFIVVEEDRKDFETLITSFRGRLSIKNQSVKANRGNCIEEVSALFSNMETPRALFLHGNCVPDVDLIRSCAVVDDADIIAVAVPRFYPQEKFYPFKRGWPIDYDGLKMHSVKFSESKDREMIDPLEYIQESCFGLASSTELLRTLWMERKEIPSYSDAVARHIIKSGNPIQILHYQARITCLRRAKQLPTTMTDEAPRVKTPERGIAAIKPVVVDEEANVYQIVPRSAPPVGRIFHDE
jgi:hypothetical protein